MNDELSEKAMDEWYALRNGGSDKPKVTVWMPTSLPNVYVHTSNNGCTEPETLNPGEPWGTATIGGVDFTMPYADLELMFAAVMEMIAFGRRRITNLQEAEIASSAAPVEGESVK